MSEYRHELKKFADAGLQLRLPVDLIPPTQYGRLTNGLPVIEGTLRTRDGLAFLANITQSAFGFELLNSNPLVTTVCDTVLTVNPHGYIAGDALVLNVIYLQPNQANSVVLGTYNVTVTAVNTVGTTPSISFTPTIAPTPTWPVFAFIQITSSALTNVLPSTPITNLFRLNQSVSSYPGNRIACLAGRVFQAVLPAGNVFEELVGPIAPNGNMPTAPIGFSGTTFSIIEFRFTKDTISWALFADTGAMYKFRPGSDDTQIEFVQLGNAPPTVAATATAGGVGNLNSTGGTGYDWRYTYMDGFALTESNPSPITTSGGGVSTLKPTTFTNPANAGDIVFTNPAQAFDASLTTYAEGQANPVAVGSVVVTERASCQWQGWAPAAGTVTAITLNVLAFMSVAADNDGGGTASASATLSYSFDSGITWYTLKSIVAKLNGGVISTGPQTFSATVPSAAALTNVIVKAVAYGTAHGRSTGGDIFTAEATVDLRVYDINMAVTQSGSVVQLALTNQIGKVCVTPSPFPQHKFINLYRRGGSLTDNWRQVGQFPISTLVQGTCGAGTLEIDDNVSDATLSTEPILQLDNDQPVTSVTATNVPLSFIWGPAGVDARVLGCGDPSRPECVYFSKPGNADAWPPQNFIEVSSPGTPIVAGCVFNTRNFAFSQESIYELVEGLGTGTTYTPFRTPSAHGLYSPWGLAIGPAMYFVAKDGIYMTVGGQEQSIVENDIKPLFPTYDTPGRSIEGYEAVDFTQPDLMRLRYHNDELYFGYVGRDTGLRQVLVYDILKKRWRNVTTTCGLSELYSEPNTISSLLAGTVAGTVYVAGGPTDPSDLDVIENAGVSPTTTPTTLTPGLYFIRVVRYNAAGASGISYEEQVQVTITVGIQVTIPLGPPDTLSWRVFYGTTSGAENQYVQYAENTLPATRVVQITGAGTAGTVPTTNATTTISAVTRTGAHDQGAPLNQKQYGNVIFDLDPGGATNAAPVTITPFVNGEAQAQAALVVTGTGRQQIPLDLSDYFAFNTEYEVKWTRAALGGGVYSDPVLYQYDTLHFLEPAQLTHWQSQPTSFEFPGWMHVRDCYIAIRSTADAVLTVTIDNGTVSPTVQTYTVPSTGGQRRKQYIQLSPNKGLLYQFAVDSTTTAGFRIYVDDIEFRVKPWLGLLGYAVQRVVGGEVA